MKKFFILVFMVVAVGLFADGLNSNASTLKNASPDTYGAIRARAIGQWGDDHEMVLYVINKQSDAFFETMDLFDIDSTIVATQIYTWCDDKRALDDDPSCLFTVPIDWEMAAYTAKKQISAEGAY